MQIIAKYDKKGDEVTEKHDEKQQDAAVSLMSHGGPATDVDHDVLYTQLTSLFSMVEKMNARMNHLESFVQSLHVGAQNKEHLAVRGRPKPMSHHGIRIYISVKNPNGHF